MNRKNALFGAIFPYLDTGKSGLFTYSPIHPLLYQIEKAE